MYCPSCKTPNPTYYDYCSKCHLALDGSGGYEQGHRPETPPPGASSPEAGAPPSEANLEYVTRKYALEQRHKSGSGWFYWIAGMSFVNSILLLSGSTTHFVTGLGLTTFFEALALEFGKRGGTLASFAAGLAVVIDVIAIGLFVVFALYARKGKTWAYMAGFIVYGLDALILLLFKDWMSIAFHVWALVGLHGGYRALKELGALPPPVPSPQAMTPRLETAPEIPA